MAVVQWPSFFQLPVLMLMLITLLNDGTLISIGYDNVIPNPRPDKWNLRVGPKSHHCFTCTAQTRTACSLLSLMLGSGEPGQAVAKIHTVCCLLDKARPLLIVSGVSDTHRSSSPLPASWERSHVCRLCCCCGPASTHTIRTPSSGGCTCRPSHTARSSRSSTSRWRPLMHNFPCHLIPSTSLFADYVERTSIQQVAHHPL